MTFALSSYARWARTRLTISSASWTLEDSRNPCATLPAPSVPGLASSVAPTRCEATKRLSPIGSSPSGFAKSEISSWPSSTNSFSFCIRAEIVPALSMITSRASVGIWICCLRAYPSLVPRAPLWVTWSAPYRFPGSPGSGQSDQPRVSSLSFASTAKTCTKMIATSS